MSRLDPTSRALCQLLLLLSLPLLVASSCDEEASPTGTDDEPAVGVTVAITAPADGSTHVAGRIITFTGGAELSDGAALAGDALVWSSDLDGQLGTGVTCEASLTAGDHTITLTAGTAGDKSATASIAITVVEPQTFASIGSPADGATFAHEAVIAFSGAAEDQCGAALTGDELVWTSSRDGQIGTGTGFSTTLTSGGHLITLTATSGDGAVGTATVYVTVEAAPISYDMTGAWTYSTYAGWTGGISWPLPQPMSGTCDIVQVGGNVTMLFTSGMDCDPYWECDFAGTADGLYYNLGNSDAVGDDCQFGSLELIAGSANYLSGDALFVYQWDCDEIATSSWGYGIDLFRIVK